MYDLPGWRITDCRDFTDLIVKNLSVLNPFAVYGNSKLSNIVIENDKLSSVTNGRDPERVVVLEKDSDGVYSKLIAVSPYSSFLSNDGITSHGEAFLQNCTDIKEIHINNDVYYNYNGQPYIVLTHDDGGKTLVMAVNNSLVNQ